jgi:D-3-phosphoglycerate dehydrogenase
MTVLIADKFDQTGIEQLEAIGCRVQLSPDLTADNLPAAVSENDPDVLIVRSTKVQAAALEAAHRLSLIA